MKKIHLIFVQLFQGRLDSSNYILAFIFVLPVNIVYGFAEDSALAMSNYFIIYSVIVSVIYVGASIRRFHDIRRSGLFTVLLFIPRIGGIFSLMLLMAKGEPNPNIYGPVPNRGKNAFRAVINLPE